MTRDEFKEALAAHGICKNTLADQAVIYRGRIIRYDNTDYQKALEHIVNEIRNGQNRRYRQT